MEALWSEADKTAVEVMDRIQTALRKQNEFVYEYFMGICETQPEKEWVLSIDIGSIRFQQHHDRWFSIFRMSSPRPVQLFDGKLALGRPNYSWDYHAVRNEVLPALARFLILEDLASL